MRTIELADGITATVADDVSSATIAALRDLASKARYREKYGYRSLEPMKVEDGIGYENRDIRCAACGAWSPGAPWPTNSTALQHRPRCGKCESAMTYPCEKPPAACLRATT